MDFTILSKILHTKNIEYYININNIENSKTYFIQNAINDFLSKKNIYVVSLINLEIIHKLLTYFAFRLLKKQSILFNYLKYIVLNDIDMEICIKKKIIRRFNFTKTRTSTPNNKKHRN